MGQLVEFPLQDGGTVLVEVHETTRAGGTVTRGLHGEPVTERARQSFEDAVQRVEPAAQAIITRLRGMSETPCKSSSVWTYTPKLAPLSPPPVPPPTSKSP